MAPSPPQRPAGLLRATSFGAVAEEYDRFRLAPSPAASEWVLPRSAAAVVDVGAGTGQLTRVLVKRCAEVTAVEPDARMRAVLARRTPEALVREGTAERLPVADGSQDAVLSHAAWHWFDAARAVAEAARVLRPGGRLGALRTSIDPAADWLEDFWRHLEPDPRLRHPGGRPRRWPRLNAAGAKLRRARQFGSWPSAAFGTQQGPYVVHHRTHADRVQLVGLAATFSGVVARPPDEKAAMLDAVRSWVQSDRRFAAPEGIEIPLVTTCWRAERR